MKRVYFWASNLSCWIGNLESNSGEQQWKPTEERRRS